MEKVKEFHSLNVVMKFSTTGAIRRNNKRQGKKGDTGVPAALDPVVVQGSLLISL